MIAIPLIAGLICLFVTRWSALGRSLATLIDLAIGAYLWSAYDPSARNAIRVELVAELWNLLGSRHRRHRPRFDHAVRVPNADLHRGELARDHQAACPNTWQRSC